MSGFSWTWRWAAGLGVAVGLGLAACGPAGALEGRLAVGLDAGPVETSTSARDAGPAADAGGRGEGCAEPTLTSIRRLVFVPSCGLSGCHLAPTPAEGLDLTLAVPELATRLGRPAHESSSGLALVKPGQVGASYLYLKVFLDSPPLGERMPRGRTPLEACQLDAIRAWIAAGAPN